MQKIKESTIQKRCREKKQSVRTYLHHEENSVENNEDHDKVLKGRTNYDPPNFILERVLVLGHVPLKGLGLNGKVNAALLVLVELALLELLLALLLEGDDN